MSRVLTCAIALFAVLSGACDRPDDEAGARVDACTLLRAADVTRVLGGEVSAPDATTDEGADALAGRSGCAWATTAGNAAVLVELIRTDDMSDVVRRTGFSATARWEAARSRHSDADQFDIDGASALWVEEAATLHLLAGRSYLTFEVAVPSPSAARRAATSLAVRAMERLPDRAD